MMADMKRKPAFGSALAPIVPTPEDEAALTEAARAEGFADRGAGVSVAETATPDATPSAKAKSVSKASDKPKARKPATRTPLVSAEFGDLVENYLGLIAAGEDLPNPPNPMWKKVDRHRVYSMFPVHTAAALQAYSDAKGYRQLWMGIDDLLRSAGVYETEE